MMPSGGGPDPVRIALVIGAVLLAGAAMRVAIVEYYAPQGELAPASFIRRTGQAAGVASLQAAATASTRAEAEAALVKARAAIRVDPLSSQAFIAAAFAQQTLGRDREAMRTMAVALNRDPRNLAARRWMIAQTLRQGRYADALGHIDAALLQRPTLSAEMTRAIVPLLAAPGMVEAFADRMHDNPPWAPAFFDSARRNPFVAPQLTALMIRLSRDAKAQVAPATIGMVVTSTLGRGDARSARRIYGAFYPQADDNASGVLNGGLTAEERPPPFGWSLAPDGTADVQFVRDGNVAGLEVRPLGGDPRVMAEQALTLPAGRYLLGSDIASAALTGGAAARWVLRCARGGELGSLALPGGGRDTRVTAIVQVPPACPIQSLGLFLAQDSRSGGTMLVDAVSIERAGSYVGGTP